MKVFDIVYSEIGLLGELMDLRNLIIEGYESKYCFHSDESHNNSFGFYCENIVFNEKLIYQRSMLQMLVGQLD